MYQTAKLNEENSWTFEFCEVPSNVTYTVYEIPVNNYKTEYSGNAKDGFTITNTYTDDDIINPPPVEETPPADISGNDDSPKAESKPSIPKTGTNLFPIYVLIVIGILIFLIGILFVFK